MTSTVRLALLCFSFLPLQRWLNITGAALMLLGALPLLTGRAPGAGPLGVALGAVLIALTPFFCGGFCLRCVSTRMALHLRPHGRLRLLLGTILAVTLLALLALIAALLLRAMLPPSGRNDPGHPLGLEPIELFVATWSICAMWWIAQFALSGSRSRIAVPWLVFAAMLLLGTQVSPRLENLAADLIPGPWTAFLVATLCCTAFATWYMRVPPIRRTGWQTFGSQWGAALTTVAARPEDTRAIDARLSRHNAERLYLLGSLQSPTAHLAGGAVTMAFIALLELFFLRQRVGTQYFLYFLLPLLAFSGTVVGYGLVRRARLLWLRTQSDRSGLHARSEWLGLRVALLRVAGGWVAICFLLLLRGEPVTRLVTTGVTIALFTCCGFYAGLSMTRSFALGTWLGSLGLTFLLVNFSYFLFMRSSPSASVGVAVTAWASLALLALLLRAWSLHKWHRLDWRLARAAPETTF